MKMNIYMVLSLYREHTDRDLIHVSSFKNMHFPWPFWKLHVPMIIFMLFVDFIGSSSASLNNSTKKMSTLLLKWFYSSSTS